MHPTAFCCWLQRVNNVAYGQHRQMLACKGTHTHTFTLSGTPSNRPEYFSIYSYECECLELYFLHYVMAQPCLRSDFLRFFDSWDEAHTLLDVTLDFKAPIFGLRDLRGMFQVWHNSFSPLHYAEYSKAWALSWKNTAFFAGVLWVLYQLFEGMWLAGKWKPPFPYLLAMTVENSYWGNRFLEAVQFNF